MAVTISRAVHDALVAAASARPDVEVCGLLFGASNRIDAMQATANVAENAARRFEIDPVALIAAHRRARNGGAAITGYYHSHPDGAASPSIIDREHAGNDGAIWAIVAGRRVALWRANADGFDLEAMVVAD